MKNLQLERKTRRSNQRLNITSRIFLIIFCLLYQLGKGNGVYLSGCERCAQAGDCGEAFHGGPGKFCGRWEGPSGGYTPCCCPLGSTCKLSTYSCKCHVSDQSHGHEPTKVYHEDHHLGPIITFIILVITIVIAVRCCRSSETSDSSAPYSAAPSAPPEECAPVIYAEAAPVKPVHTSYDSVGTSPGGNLGAAALGAVAGFVAGTALEARRPGRSDGGYDIAGDSGGYDIAGDSGGYDISGDS